MLLSFINKIKTIGGFMETTVPAPEIIMDRHGDVGFRKIDVLPERCKKPSQSKVIFVGSHNNSHAYDNGIWFPVEGDEFVIGYLVAKNTTLTHPDHGEPTSGQLRTAKLENGIYEVRKQVEITHQGMRPVDD
jgi:hypothetical protein